jgi:hypothetical protein
MLREVAGDILLTKAEALAHGVAPNDNFANGLALALRERWPAMYKDFRLSDLYSQDRRIVDLGRCRGRSNCQSVYAGACRQSRRQARQSHDREREPLSQSLV